MGFRLLLVVIALAALLGLVMGRCPNPPPAAQFSIERYTGLWYEIAKIQTAGGAYFEKDCKCTQIYVTYDPSVSKSTKAKQSCIKHNKNVTIDATLLPTDVKGKYVEAVYFNRVGYWVIELDEDTAIQFDCGDTLGVINYCIHVMSRTKTLPPERTKQLLNYALSLGLNPNSLPVHVTEQQKCTSDSLRQQ